MKTENSDFGMERKATTTKWAVAAFTLIELLMVIAIIGILAALIVGGAVLAKAKVARYTAESQRDALVTAIDRYFHDKGYYPPDNAFNGTNIDSVRSSLFYEITSCSNTPSGAIIDKVTSETVSPAALAGMGVSGILNGADPSTVKNYYNNLKAAQHSVVTNGANGNYAYSVFGIPTAGPVMYQGTNVNNGKPINPFHYVKSNPTNNPSSYDLWIDVLWSGNTNRVSNWRPDPQAL